jgi:uncharacterized membrane protein YagU involved in acid resistance
MAQVYYPKKTSAKYLDGAVAGLLGGGVTAVVATVADALTPDRSWWTSLSILGSIFTGASNFNTDSPDWGSWIIGLLLTLVAFALFGLGLVGYIPLFRRFNINSLLGGALYGLLLWVAVDLIFLNPLTSGRLSMIALLVANLLAGAAMAWWLTWANKVQPGSSTVTVDEAHDGPVSKEGT